MVCVTLHGFGGNCYDTAVAINRLLFDGHGTIVGAFNKTMMSRGRCVGHVGVKDKGDSIWDAEGSYDGDGGREEFRAWAMLDPSDSEYGLTPIQASATVIVPVHKNPGFRATQNVGKILAAAVKEFRNA